MTKIKTAYSGLFLSFLLTFVVFVILSSPALAAKSVKGTVPELQPLQPAPSGINANVSGNIQYVGVPGDVDSGNELVSSTPFAAPTYVPGSAHSRIFWLFGPETQGQTTAKAVKNFSFLIFVLILVVATVYYFKREK